MLKLKSGLLLAIISELLSVRTILSAFSPDDAQSNIMKLPGIS